MVWPDKEMPAKNLQLFCSAAQPSHTAREPPYCSSFRGKYSMYLLKYQYCNYLVPIYSTFLAFSSPSAQFWRAAWMLPDF